ncbi:hypothetical protein AAULH_07256 [Lactobacillus helveticus MTCC 5463]|nr:hypothetical protein AAULH_07256 [Lactobacillus helveticus MTCC 5463]
MQRLWVTGYRSYELNVFSDKDPKITIIKYALKNYFKGLLENNQLDWIITGANLGVEQWTAEVGLELGQKYPLRTSIMIPYEKFADRWNENNQTKFLNFKKTKLISLLQLQICLIKIQFNYAIIKILCFSILIEH